MPTWLKSIVVINPLSYVVDAMRALLVTGDFSSFPQDIFALVITTVVLVTLASFSFRKILS
jgi:ABC-2 type transport system permease protein